MSCIEHRNKPGADGYCVETYNGRATRAHRVAYAVANNLNPHSMGGVVMHSCDNPRCVNPEHLSLGDRLLNAQDRDRKGRQARVLTDEQVIELRRRYTARCPINGGSAMAREFGVHQTVVSEAVRGHSFRHLGGGL
uniref:HNH homing endonuclease n=4 Tax=unclassified bacterial viruses TaxID=12333 RepID=A0AAU6W0L0_9VIRU